jgi:hypothetical protein
MWSARCAFGMWSFCCVKKGEAGGVRRNDLSEKLSGSIGGPNFGFVAPWANAKVSEPVKSADISLGEVGFLKRGFVALHLIHQTPIRRQHIDKIEVIAIAKHAR